MPRTCRAGELNVNGLRGRCALFKSILSKRQLLSRGVRDDLGLVTYASEPLSPLVIGGDRRSSGWMNSS